MLKINKILILVCGVLLVSASCAPKIQKPVMTVAEYASQVTKIREVVNKLMNEKDIVVMNYMAEGVESTRAIPCDSIGEECNAYYEFLNKVIDVSNDGEISEDDLSKITTAQKKVFTELSNSEKIIQKQWKEFINSEASK